jgi:RES domain-containing protein
VLTVNNARQARERAGGRWGNKGAEAMHAALDTLAVLRAIRKGAGAAGAGSGRARRAKGAR